MAAEKVKRKLTAILSADVKGYSRLMGDDEEATVRTITAYREVMIKLVEELGGRVVDAKGDNVLAEFPSVVDALRSSVGIQEELAKRNAELPEHRKMAFRIGVNLGDVIEEEGAIYGDGVNIAARLEALAEGGGICISRTAFDQVRNKLKLGFEYLGEHSVKNIAQPVRVYKVLTEPEAAGKVIGEAGSKRVARRYPAVAGLMAVIVIAGAIAFWHFNFRRPPIEPARVNKMALPLPDKPSIAVLPFVNMSDDPKQEYFCDGLTDTIITSLSRIPHLFVIASNSTSTYKGKPVKVQQVAEDLGVRYVLEGSMQKAEKRIRVRAQLIDAITGRHMWAESYDRSLEDIFAIQDEIAGKVITSLQVELTSGEHARATGKVTKNLQALELFWRANYHLLRLTKEDNNLSRQYSEKAVEIDPEFSAAWAELGFTHNWDATLGWSSSREQSLKLAEECAQKALSLNPLEPKAFILLCQISTSKGEHDKAIQYAERAVEVNPNDMWAFFFLGRALALAGRHEEAAVNFRKAMRLTPYYPALHLSNLAYSSFFLRRYDDALSEGERFLARCRKGEMPDWMGNFLMVVIYSELGQEEKARKFAAEILNTNPNWNLEIIKRSHPYKNQSDMDRILGAGRKAGLPDKPPLPLPDKPSIAVLPFTNMSDDPKQEFFADGLAEEIINGLSRIAAIFVIARNSSFTYKGKTVDLKQVAREMGVQYVLEGSARKEGDRLRLTAQLIDALKGHHVFSERYEGEMKNLFALQDEITKKILVTIVGKMSRGEEEAQLTARGTTNLNAYLKLMEIGPIVSKGMNRDTNAMVRRIVNEAMALDPGWHAPYASMAYAYLGDVMFMASSDPKESLAKAIQTAQKAISLDETQPRPYCALSMTYVFMREYDKAIAAAERAVLLGPNDGEAYWILGSALYHACQPEEAIPYFQKAMRISPVPDIVCLQNLGGSYRMLGRYEDAEGTYKRLLQRAPDHLFGRTGLLTVYVETGRMEEARTEAAEVLRINPQISVERFSRMLSFKEQTQVDRIIDDLRKAGLK